MRIFVLAALAVSASARFDMNGVYGQDESDCKQEWTTVSSTHYCGHKDGGYPARCWDKNMPDVTQCQNICGSFDWCIGYSDNGSFVPTPVPSPEPTEPTTISGHCALMTSTGSCPDGTDFHSRYHTGITGTQVSDFVPSDAGGYNCIIKSPSPCTEPQPTPEPTPRDTKPPTTPPTLAPSPKPVPDPTPAPTEKQVDPNKICKLIEEKKPCNSMVTWAGNCSWDKKKNKCSYKNCDSYSNKGWKCPKVAKKAGLECYWNKFDDKCTEVMPDYVCSDYDTKKACKKFGYHDGACKYDKETKSCIDK